MGSKEKPWKNGRPGKDFSQLFRQLEGEEPFLPVTSNTGQEHLVPPHVAYTSSMSVEKTPSEPKQVEVTPGDSSQWNVEIEVPALNIKKYEGQVTTELILTDFIPNAKAALIASGYTEVEANNYVGKSLQVVSSEADLEKRTKMVRTILHNLAAAVEKKKVQNQAASEPVQKAAVPGDVQIPPIPVAQTGEVQPAVEIKPDSNAQLVRLSKAQKKKIRGHDAYRAEQEDKWYRDPNENDGGLDDYEQQRMRENVSSIPLQDGVVDTQVEPDAEDNLSVKKVVERMSRQMNTIRDRTRGMREGLDLSHKEATAQIESFSDSRKNVRLIREKLKRILKEGNFDAHAEEVQVLRDQLAKELRDFRKYGAVDAKINESLTNDFEAMDQGELPFEEVRNKSDINKNGNSTWYRNNIPSHKTFMEVFMHLNSGFDVTAVLHPKMKEIVATQKKIQELLKQYDLKPKEFSESNRAEFFEAAKKLESMQEAFAGKAAPSQKVESSELNPDAKAENNKQRELRSGDTVSAYVTEGVKVEAVVRSIPGSGLVAIGWTENGKYRTATVPSELLTLVHGTEVADSVVAENVVVETTSVLDEGVQAESALPAVEMKEYEKRNEVRAEWTAKKKAYKNEYIKYLEAQGKKTWKEKLQFWNKEEQPEALVEAQKEYQEARAIYAQVLQSALYARAFKRVDLSGLEGKKITGKKGELEKLEGLESGFQAGLANRFVIASAEMRLTLEKEVLLKNSRAARIFESIAKKVGENRTKIRVFGYLAATGIGIATGGLVGALQALLGRTVRAKAAMLGGAAGASAGRFIADIDISRKEGRKTMSGEKARTSFSVDSIKALEAVYYNDAEMLEAARKRAKYIVGGGALLGSLTGSALVGGISNFESHNVSSPDMLGSHPPAKIGEQLSPEQSVPGAAPVRDVYLPGTQGGTHIAASERPTVLPTAEPEVQVVKSEAVPTNERDRVAYWDEQLRKNPDRFIADRGAVDLKDVPVETDSKVIPSPYTFEQAQALKAPYISENFMYPHKLADGSYREATPAEIASGDYLPLVEDQVVVNTDGDNIEHEPRTYLGVDDEGYGGDEEDEEPGAGQSTEGYPEAPIIPDISFESGQPVFFMPPHTGMNQILDTHAEWYYNYNHDQGNPVAIDENISRTDFVTNASHLQEAMKMYPEDYARVFDAMEIPSHNFDDVRVGQKICLEPFFELLKYYKE